MSMGSSQRLAISVALGYAVIINLIGSSYLEFYPPRFLIGAAFGVGFAMVIGVAYALLREPKPRVLAVHKTVPVPKRVRTLAKAPAAAPC